MSANDSIKCFFFRKKMEMIQEAQLLGKVEAKAEATKEVKKGAEDA